VGFEPAARGGVEAEEEEVEGVGTEEEEAIEVEEEKRRGRRKKKMGEGERVEGERRKSREGGANLRMTRERLGAEVRDTSQKAGEGRKESEVELSISWTSFSLPTAPSSSSSFSLFTPISYTS